MDDIFIIFMIKRGDVFFHENSIFMKKWTGDEIRLMTRVLPRPLVLQGGKSMRYQNEQTLNSYSIKIIEVRRSFIATSLTLLK